MGHSNGSSRPSLETPVEVAASRFIKIQLRTIEKALPSALCGIQSDIECVHKLRVACRRAEAAIFEFADCFPNRSYSKLRKSVARIRRAAGDARDWDVFMTTSQGWKGLLIDDSNESLCLIHGFAIGQRMAAQWRLIESVGKQGPLKLIKRWRSTVEEIRAPKTNMGIQVVADLMVRHLDQGLANLVRALDRNGDSARQLHESRITAKKLRYAVELYGNCCPESWRKGLLPALVAQQDIFGGIHDGQVAMAHVKSLTDFLEDQDRPLSDRVTKGLVDVISALSQKCQELEPKRLKCEMRWHSLPIAELQKELAELRS